MKKVVFLDRDGVINFEPNDYTYQVSKFKILDGLFDSLSVLKQKGFEFIVVTNQGGISKGIYNHQDVSSVHEYMSSEFNTAGLDILDIYYCPHHSINENCICRKPGSLMLEKALAKYNINKAEAYFVGDSDRDIVAAERAGIKGIKIEKNDKLSNYLNQF